MCNGESTVIEKLTVRLTLPNEAIAASVPTRDDGPCHERATRETPHLLVVSNWISRKISLFLGPMELSSMAPRIWLGTIRYTRLVQGALFMCAENRIQEPRRKRDEGDGTYSVFQVLLQLSGVNSDISFLIYNNLFL